MKMNSFFWSLPFCAFLLGYFLIYFFYRHEIQVPNLIGKQLPDAVMLLSDYNINVRITNTHDNDDLPTGTIIGQVPMANTKIKPNQSVFLVISKHKTSDHTIANYVGKNISEIQEEVATTKIHPTFYYVASEYPHSTCIAQYPTTGKLAKESSIILYIAERQKKPVIMPTLINRTVQEVQESLEKYPVKLQCIAAAPNQSPQGMIMQQYPPPGTLLIFDEKNPLEVKVQVQ